MMADGFGIPGLEMLFFWGVVILLAVVLIRGVSHNFKPRPNKSARELLDERFARGEIEQREYRSR